MQAICGAGESEWTDVVSFTTMECRLAGKDTAAEISVYPNPVEIYLNIDISDLAEEEIRIEIYDLLGKKIQQLTMPYEVSIHLDIHEIPSGIYTINIFSSGHSLSQQFIKN